jgi:diaminopimelate epimerase
MKKVPFLKFTLLGNNFVIVDETSQAVLTETEKSRFAYQATNMNFGVGADNFLILQPCRPETLKEIKSVRHYWNKLPDALNADYIFRMFEPDGEEAFSCGNGLMCIANYLYRMHGMESARILTRIPTSKPKVISIGTNPENGTSWANMGHPEKIPRKLAHQSITTPYNEVIDIVKGLSINNFRQVDGMRFLANETSLDVSGYLVSTGEPHFIIFTETGFSQQELGSQMFISSSLRNPIIRHPEKRMSSSSALVDFIGRYFDREYSHLFPAGINIDFVRMIDGSEILEYRCFERGINRETLACGTGAVAAAFIARKLGMFTTNQISVWPHRCRWHDPQAEIRVEACENGWLLYGDPVMLFEGVFILR